MAFLEVDGDTGGNQVLATYHTLVEEEETAGTGAILLSLRGVVTEATTHAGVQGIITVRTKGTTPATLGTLTFVDNQPIGDIIDGSVATFWGEHTSSDDISAYCIPAGYGIECALTTAGYETAADGDGTGKMLVVVEYVVVPRRVGEF
jgi:hypothetical protein